MARYDIAVIGSGPAGLTAALYARRAGKSVLVLEKENFGGQITFSPKVENYPTHKALSGAELSEQMLDQVQAQGAELEMDHITAISKDADGFTLTGDYGEYLAKTVILAAGSKHRTLGLPNEESLVGSGVCYCAVCDGAFFKGQDVAVIGIIDSMKRGIGGYVRPGLVIGHVPAPPVVSASGLQLYGKVVPPAIGILPPAAPYHGRIVGPPLTIGY